MGPKAQSVISSSGRVVNAFVSTRETLWRSVGEARDAGNNLHCVGRSLTPIWSSDAEDEDF